MKTREIMVEAGILAAMVNDDYSGLTDNDIASIRIWESQNPGWHLTAGEGEPSFGRCEVLHLACDCVAATAFYTAAK